MYLQSLYEVKRSAYSGHVARRNIGGEVIMTDVFSIVKKYPACLRGVVLFVSRPIAKLGWCRREHHDHRGACAAKSRRRQKRAFLAGLETRSPIWPVPKYGLARHREYHPAFSKLSRVKHDGKGRHRAFVNQTSVIAYCPTAEMVSASVACSVWLQ